MSNTTTTRTTLRVPAGTGGTDRQALFATVALFAAALTVAAVVILLLRSRQRALSTPAPPAPPGVARVPSSGDAPPAAHDHAAWWGVR